MIYLRVSTLEEFRRLLQTDYGDEQELIDRIKRGQWTEGGRVTWQMQAGTAWHAALEGKDHGPGYYFDPYDVNLARAHIGPGMYEVQGLWPVKVSGRDVVLTGKADHINGKVIQDTKTKFSTPSARDYEQSLQWRSYLVIHDCDEFRYNLFRMSNPDEEDGSMSCREVVSFSFFRYPQIEADVKRWLTEFLAWAEAKNLIPYLEKDVPR